ncbi:hypothetical protein [Epilithonimonas hungarica]|uniref:Uncharacterized protein n=1 Tax=Epilithonimonas hungarica TaxID=454006 RepID=A0A1G7PIL6_9FLAO|nr:hypothetical protein [Epilithonimonas hungarica]SDF85509.1 hypothetical protein SAMN05421825_2293 [Epilithonimonas hungarica]
MAPVYETGHAKNVANFQDLISFCQSYGTTYNPTKENLKIPQLQLLYQEAQSKLDDAKTQKATFDNATNSRRNTFADLRSLSTRVINALAVSGADALAIEDAKAINKKIQGTSSKKPTSTETPTTSEGAGGGISTSQQSYDRLIDHFTSLIELLNQNKSYAPNEDDLKTTTLQTKLTEMKTANTELINAFTANSNAMISRNETLYHKQTGLVQISKEVKQYIKSVFGAGSPQYDQVNGLEFKVRRN